MRSAAELPDAAVAGEHLGAVHGLPLPVERAGGRALAWAGGPGICDRGRAAGAAAGEVAGTAQHAAVGAGDWLGGVRDLWLRAEGVDLPAWHSADEPVGAGRADGAGTDERARESAGAGAIAGGGAVHPRADGPSGAGTVHICLCRGDQTGADSFAGRAVFAGGGNSAERAAGGGDGDAEDGLRGPRSLEFDSGKFDSGDRLGWRVLQRSDEFQQHFVERYPIAMGVHDFADEAEADGELCRVAGAAIETVPQRSDGSGDVIESGGEEGDGFESSFACRVLPQVQAVNRDVV